MSKTKPKPKKKRGPKPEILKIRDLNWKRSHQAVVPEEKTAEWLA